MTESLIHSLRALKRYRNEITLPLLAPEIRRAWQAVRRSAHWAPFHARMTSPSARSLAAQAVDLTTDAISATLSPDADITTLRSLCEAIIPWRVGPYQFGDLLIDAEWRSEIKWKRVSPLLGTLHGARVADVGCSNGYHLFKLSASEPEVALGFDPVDRCWLQFCVTQTILRAPNLGFVPVGISALDAFPEFFDLVICMGVIYHQRDPFTACKKLFQATKPGGRVLLESLTIPERGSHMLIPRERYAKMRNAWIIPTPGALAALLSRAGFEDIAVHHFGPITTEEQRRTPWAPYESLADFLDPNDPSRTIEGYPAPHSAAVTATRRS